MDPNAFDVGMHPSRMVFSECHFGLNLDCREWIFIQMWVKTILMDSIWDPCNAIRRMELNLDNLAFLRIFIHLKITQTLT